MTKNIGWTYFDATLSGNVSRGVGGTARHHGPPGIQKNRRATVSTACQVRLQSSFPGKLKLSAVFVGERKSLL